MPFIGCRNLSLRSFRIVVRGLVWPTSWVEGFQGYPGLLRWKRLMCIPSIQIWCEIYAMWTSWKEHSRLNPKKVTVQSHRLSCTDRWSFLQLTNPWWRRGRGRLLRCEGPGERRWKGWTERNSDSIARCPCGWPGLISLWCWCCKHSRKWTSLSIVITWSFYWCILYRSRERTNPFFGKGRSVLQVKHIVGITDRGKFVLACNRPRSLHTSMQLRKDTVGRSVRLASGSFMMAWFVLNSDGIVNILSLNYQ